MSNSVFQSVIVQLKDIPGRTFGVMDTEGSVVSCTDVSMLGERWSDAAVKVSGAGDARLRSSETLPAQAAALVMLIIRLASLMSSTRIWDM